MGVPAKATLIVGADVAELIREAVADGHFASADEALRSALQGLKANRSDLLGFEPAEIERLWDEGIASGAGLPADFEAIKTEVSRRVARSRE